MSDEKEKPPVKIVKEKPETKQTKESLKRKEIYDHYLKAFGFTLEEIKAIKAFVKLGDQEKVLASRKIIQDSIIEATKEPDACFSMAIEESENLIKGYATLDDPHRQEIQRLIQQISDYLHDSTRKRPFNALMLAAPGAGKSHFIKQLAKNMKEERVEAVTFNMATMQSNNDLAQPIDDLRNIKVNDKFPLLFLDEFDTDPSRYATLLPLLWDGELQIGHRDLKLGKSVIILSGSNPDLPKAMNFSEKMNNDLSISDSNISNSKLVDLISRINGGVINIPDLDLRSENRDRRVDKVCISVALLKRRFGQDIEFIPRSLLRFIAHTTFRYGVRSIAHLLDMIDCDAFMDGDLKSNKLNLPLKNVDDFKGSSLSIHFLDKNQSFGIVNRWKEFSKDSLKVAIDRKIPYSLIDFYLESDE
jgi:hypothetical protein